MTSGTRETLDAFFAALLDDDPRELYDRAPCGYLSTTPDGTIVKANEWFLELIGYARHELVGRVRFDELLSPGGRIYHETHFVPLLRMQGTVREVALDLVRRDGERLPVLVNAVLERDAEGDPRIVRTAVFDARLRRGYERELLRAKERAEASESQAKALAQTLQQTLIPPTPPAIAGLDVAAQYRPAGDGTEVGGDFYDIFPLGVDDWAIVIGDVCGKGVAAAVMTALIRHTLREAAVLQASPAEALTALNGVLQQHESEKFCTVSFLRLRRIDGAWRGVLGLAGHPPAMFRAADGALRRTGRSGSLLGVLDHLDLEDVPVALDAGDALLLYTDGLPEGRHGNQFFGEDRIAAVLGADHESADAVATALLSDVLQFQAGRARDDIALVVVRVPVEAERASQPAAPG